MLYPVYVHPGDADHAHGVTFPDFPGCFSAADTWSDLPAAVQEAVLADIQGFALAQLPAARLVGTMDSPITGTDGNREFLLGLRKAG